MSKYLHRDEAPFGATVWNHIDEVVIGTHAGVPGTESRLGSTARELLVCATVPVVVVPQDLPD